MTRPLLFLAVLAVLAIIACGDPASPEQDDLTRAEARWAATGLNARGYVLQQQRACFCPDAQTVYTVTVRGGDVVLVSDPTTGLTLTADHNARFRTVPALFEEIRAAMRGPAVLLEVSYDPQRGFPRVVSLDRIPAAADDEVTYATSSVTPAP